ncbi:hypothetical protein PJ985_11450 [Streptomyces sp. ACA25]|uniref:hypothetical protein n=1 Tax=Streptomyces sp. ACA25 TaxID=3022596 RepID=UPI0023070CC2|nr:hypothetical protein [Streptomyces sp. ACA25]MDB1088180.1 hypothetical protein [Streptomyces sp. ACA25]
MLTIAPSFPSPVALTGRTFFCECVAYTVGEPRLHRLGAHEVASAWGAVLWLAWRAAHVADQLDPPAARPVRDWLADRAESERAWARLEAGRGYALLVRDGPVRYAVSAVPGSPAG